MEFRIASIKKELESLRTEKKELDEETNDLLKVIAGNKRRIAEIEGRIIDLVDTLESAKMGDSYAAHLAGH